MANRALTEAAILDRVQNMCLHAIVSEAFIGAVPIPEDDLTDDMTHKLAVYVKESLDDLGGFHLLESAIESCREPIKRAFLKQIRDICTESAKEVTKRVLDSDDIEKKDLDDVANGVAMTASEYEKFVKRATSVDSDTLSKMIQKKTLQTIKDEKEAYKKDEDLKQELKDAMNSDSDDVKAAAENFVNHELEVNEKGDHVTFFSKLQEVVYEALLYTTESYEDIPFETMSAITRENTFDRFTSHNKSAVQAFESVCRYKSTESVATPDGGEPPVDNSKALNSALITTSLIYTFFETLMTMNLWCPKMDDIMAFIKNTLPLNKRIDIDKATFMNAIDGIVANAKHNLRAASTPAEVDAAKNDLEIVREKCAESKNFTAEESAYVTEKLDKVIEQMNHKFDVLSNESPKAVVESAFQAMARGRDTTQFNRVASIIGKKPNVDRIRFKVNHSSDHANQIAVEGLDAMNQVVSCSHITLEQTGSDVIGYVKNAIKASKLPDTNKKLEIYIAGGRHPVYGNGILSVE